MDFTGLLVAVLAAVFNGSFGVLSKIKRVQDAQVQKLDFLHSISKVHSGQGQLHNRNSSLIM